jgi:hypothetical protein
MAVRIETDAGREVAPARALWRATAEAGSAGQQVILDRVELLRTELGDDLRDLAVAVGTVVAASVVVLIGWVIAAVAFAFLLAEWMPMEAALGIVALLHLLGGGFMARQAVHRFHEAKRVEALTEAPPPPPHVLHG